MTLRLSALFESHIKSVINNWKTACRRANKNKKRVAGKFFRYNFILIDKKIFNTRNFIKTK